MGVPEHEAKHYQDQVGRGKTLVIIRAGDDDSAERAADILESCGGAGDKNNEVVIEITENREEPVIGKQERVEEIVIGKRQRNTPKRRATPSVVKTSK